MKVLIFIAIACITYDGVIVASATHLAEKARDHTSEVHGPASHGSRASAWSLTSMSQILDYLHHGNKRGGSRMARSLMGGDLDLIGDDDYVDLDPGDDKPALRQCRLQQQQQQQQGRKD
jgi:hypothetical protein